MFPFPFSFVAPTASGLADIDNVYSMEFDGASEYVCVGKDLNSLFQSAFSYSTWINFPATSGAYGSFLSAGYPLQCYIYNGTVKMWISNSNGTSSESIPASSALTTNTWHHIVFTRSGNGAGNTNKIYINNSLDVTDSSDTSVALSTSNLTIGAWEDPSGTPNYYYTGKLDEIAIFNYELDSDQVEEIYNATSTGKTADLSTMATPPVAWYRMGD